MNRIRALAGALAVSGASLLMGCMSVTESSDSSIGKAPSDERVGEVASAITVWQCFAWPPGVQEDLHKGFGTSKEQANDNAMKDCESEHHVTCSTNLELCHIDHC